MIKPLNLHYSFENPASVYDEEAMTALELAGRQGVKINEIAQAQNTLTQETERKLQEQDASIPVQVSGAIQAHISDGTFDQQIEAITGQKIDRAGIGQVTMRNLSQEVKTAMTGGSVPVVGDSSVTTEALEDACVIPDKLDDVQSANQFIRQGYYSPGEYWGHDNTEISYSDECVRIHPFRLIKGKTYYFRSVRAYFGFIKWDDGTLQTLSETDVQMNFSIEAHIGGTCYMTIYTKMLGVATITDYPSLQTRPFVEGVSGVSFKNLFPTLKGFRKLGAKLPIRANAEVFNGAVFDGYKITIPAGSTGYNSYVTNFLPATLSGKNVLVCANFTIAPCTQTMLDKLLVAVMTTNGQDLETGHKMWTQEKDGTFTFTCEVDIPSTVNPTAPAQCFVQVGDMEVRPNTTTIQINEMYCMADDALTPKTGGGNKNSNAQVIVVDKNGGGDYTTIRQAMAAVGVANTIDTVVYVMPGTYELTEEYTEAEINAPGFIGWIVMDNTTIIGRGNPGDIVLTANLPQPMSEVSTINFMRTSGMENITVRATNCRYAVHDDWSDNRGEEYFRTMKNCVFEVENTYYNCTYGSGTKEGANWLFENCKFINHSDGKAFALHNNVGFTIPSFVHFKNCRFSTKGSSAVRFGSLNNGCTMEDTVILEGCKFTATVAGFILFEENVNLHGAGIKHRITGFGNVGANFAIENSDGVDYRGNVDLI